MKRLYAGVLVIPFLAGMVLANSLNIDPGQSGAVIVSANAGSPTQLFTSDFAATKTCLVNISSNTIYVVGYSTTSAKSITVNANFSISQSTGSFYLPGTASSTNPPQYCFDGPGDPFTGPLWAATTSGGNIVVKMRNH